MAEKITDTDCQFAIGFQCGHPHWLLNGQPYLRCQSVQELKYGCVKQPTQEAKHG